MITLNPFRKWISPALLAAASLTSPVSAELPLPQLVSVYPAMEEAANAPVSELRFDYADDVHLFNVQLATIIDDKVQVYTLFAANGAYLRGKTFVFPLQQPLTRDGTYRIQVMAQAIDNGRSQSSSYEFTIGSPDTPEE